MDFLGTTAYATGSAPVEPPANNEADQGWGDWAGIGVDLAGDAAEKLGKGANAAAGNLDRAVSILHDLDQAGIGSAEVRQLGQEAARGAGALRSTGHAISGAGEVLKGAGTVLGVIDAADGVVSAYDESRATTSSGRLLDGAIGGGARLLAGATLPVAVVDAATGGGVSGLFRAGGDGIVAMAQAATGNVEPAARLSSSFENGQYGPLVRGVSKGSEYLFETAVPKAIAAIEDAF
jgi:hypothetical protein